MLQHWRTGFNIVVVSLFSLSCMVSYFSFIFGIFFMGEGFISGSTGFKSSPIIYSSYNLKYTILPYDITQIISNTNQRIPFLFDIRLKLKKKKKIRIFKNKVGGKLFIQQRYFN